jgi:hypothetical protein
MQFCNYPRKQRRKLCDCCPVESFDALLHATCTYCILKNRKGNSEGSLENVNNERKRKKKRKRKGPETQRMMAVTLQIDDFNPEPSGICENFHDARGILNVSNQIEKKN